MKITVNQLRRIIKEEVESALTVSGQVTIEIDIDDPDDANVDAALQLARDMGITSKVPSLRRGPGGYVIRLTGDEAKLRRWFDRFYADAGDFEDFIM